MQGFTNAVINGVKFEEIAINSGNAWQHVLNSTTNSNLPSHIGTRLWNCAFFILVWHDSRSDYRTATIFPSKYSYAFASPGSIYEGISNTSESYFVRIRFISNSADIVTFEAYFKNTTNSGNGHLDQFVIDKIITVTPVGEVA